MDRKNLYLYSSKKQITMGTSALNPENEDVEGLLEATEGPSIETEDYSLEDSYKTSQYDIEEELNEMSGGYPSAVNETAIPDEDEDMLPCSSASSCQSSSSCNSGCRSNDLDL